MMNKIKFGVIGCSAIADSSMIPALLMSKYVELKIVGSRSLLKAESFAKKFSIKDFGSYDDVLASDVDAVYLSLPIGLHEEWTLKSAKAGKHILCEKSSTTSFSSAIKMVNCCKDNSVRLMEGLMFRFHPQHSKAKQIIDNHQLGNISYFHGCYALPKISYNDIRHNKKLGGGILNDAACYPICASRIIFQNEPLSVSCFSEFDKKSKVDVNTNIQLNFKSNQHASIVAGYDLFFQSTYFVLGSKGYLKLKRSYNIPKEEDAKIELVSDNTLELVIPRTNHFILMIDSFCLTILGKILPKFNFENDLINQAKILEAARISANTNEIVFLSEIN